MFSDGHGCGIFFTNGGGLEHIIAVHHQFNFPELLVIIQQEMKEVGELYSGALIITHDLRLLYHSTISTI
jgi:hypothetical protein